MRKEEKEFHKLIEQQGAEETEQAWQRIKARLNEEPEAVAQPKPKKRCPARVKKIAVICASVAIVAAAGISFSLGFGLQKPVDENRYCSMGDYEMVVSEKTLKDYIVEYNVNVLYLDWYDETEEYSNTAYRLKGTNEIICFYEGFVDTDWNYINLYVTDNKTEIDILNKFKLESQEQTVVVSTSILHTIHNHNSYASFEYSGYRYFIELELEDSDYVLNIAEQLLQSAKS